VIAGTKPETLAKVYPAQMPKITKTINKVIKILVLSFIFKMINTLI